VVGIDAVLRGQCIPQPPREVVRIDAGALDGRGDGLRDARQRPER
jgi:hypothetical protein